MPGGCDDAGMHVTLLGTGDMTGVPAPFRDLEHAGAAARRRRPGALVETDAATLLFGCGDEEHDRSLGEIVDEHGVDVGVIEHGDPDHYGAATALRENHGVEIAAPAGDRERVEAAGVEVDHPLEAGTTQWGVETIAAPGHTPGNLAYRWGDVLVAGDTVVGSGSEFAVEASDTGRLSLMVPGYNDDDAQYRESVARLLDYDVETILVTHGPNVESGGNEALRELVDALD